jgi:hypothetical protein
MAKKVGTNKRKGPSGESKTAQIKAALEKNKEATVAELVAAYKVSAGLVNKIRSDLGLTKKRKKKGKPGRKAGGEKSNGRVALNHAEEFVQRAFTLGLDSAISLLEKVKKAVSK